MNTRLSAENSNNLGDADNTNMGALYSRLMQKTRENNGPNCTNERKSNNNSNNTKSSAANSNELYRRNLRTTIAEPRIRRSERLKAKNNEMKVNSLQSDVKQQSKQESSKVLSSNKARRNNRRKKSVVTLKRDEIMKIVQEAVGHTLNKKKYNFNNKKKGQPLLHYKSKRKKEQCPSFMCICRTPSVRSENASSKIDMERTIYSCTCPSTLHTVESCINNNDKAKQCNYEVNKRTARSTNLLCKNSAISSSSTVTKMCTCKDYYDELRYKTNKENKQLKRRLLQNNARQKLLNTQRNLLMNKDYCKYYDGDSIFENNNLRYNNDYSNLREDTIINTNRKNNKIKRLNNINSKNVNAIKRKPINRKHLKQNHSLNQRKLLISLKDYLNTKIGNRCLTNHHFVNNCPCYWVNHGTWNVAH